MKAFLIGWTWSFPVLMSFGRLDTTAVPSAAQASPGVLFFTDAVLVATALPARDRAVAPFDRGSHHVAALSWADGDAAWADADGGVIAPTIPIVAVVTVVAVPPDLNIDALG
jgi:hypothetical protein